MDVCRDCWCPDRILQQWIEAPWNDHLLVRDHLDVDRHNRVEGLQSQQVKWKWHRRQCQQKQPLSTLRSSHLKARARRCLEWGRNIWRMQGNVVHGLRRKEDVILPASIHRLTTCLQSISVFSLQQTAARHWALP